MTGKSKRVSGVKVKTTEDETSLGCEVWGQTGGQTPATDSALFGKAVASGNASVIARWSIEEEIAVYIRSPAGDRALKRVIGFRGGST